MRLRPGFSGGIIIQTLNKATIRKPCQCHARYRMKLRHTRRIIDAIHNGELGRAEYATTPIFNLHIPKAVTDVPDDILTPEQQWADKAAFSKVGFRAKSVLIGHKGACISALTVNSLSTAGGNETAFPITGSLACLFHSITG